MVRTPARTMRPNRLKLDTNFESSDFQTNILTHSPVFLLYVQHSKSQQCSPFLQNQLRTVSFLKSQFIANFTTLSLTASHTRKARLSTPNLRNYASIYMWIIYAKPYNQTTLFSLCMQLRLSQSLVRSDRILYRRSLCLLISPSTDDTRLSRY